MPMTTMERSLRASRQRSKNARVRRLQRAVAELRGLGLVVIVRDEGPDGEWFDVPEYAIEETDRVAYGRR